jgi:oligoendopeptidase F
MMKLAGFLIFLLCAEICSEVHVAAQTAVPLSADLGRYYFASPAAEVAARADLDAALKRLGAFKGQLNSGSNLLKVLQAQEDVLKIYRKHAGYLHFRCSLNPKDPACESEGQLESQVDAATAFLSPEILAIPEDRLQAFYAAEAGLKPYKFAIEDIRREAAHVLPGPEQALLDDFRP